MTEVTIICCYNNEEIYGGFVKTLERQTCPHELIAINNVGNKSFTSCASAYNSVINQVKTKYVIYSHQDILLNEPDELERFVTFLRKIKPDDILGVAGAKADYPNTLTNITHLDNHTKKFIPAGDRFDVPMIECDTVDECFFGGYAEHFREYPFDEITCNDWHLYAAEACLNTRSRIGGGVFACDSGLVHLSSGNFVPQFYSGLYRLCKKYSSQFPYITTTCARSSTKKSQAFSYCLTRYVRFTIVKLLKRIGMYETARAVFGRSNTHKN